MIAPLVGQLVCISVHWVVNLYSLVCINRYKARTDGGTPLDLVGKGRDDATVLSRSRMMFALHYTLYFLLLVSVTTIDAMFAPKLDDRSGQRDLNFHLICIDAKAFSAAFSIGLLDFYLADNGVKEVPLVCFPGCLLWCLCVIIRDTFACVYFPAVPAIMARSNSIYSIATASPSFSHGCTAFLSFALREYAILMVWLVSAGLASDFFFSPMHRLTHIPTLYKSLHKEHHAYTNKLTSLVLFYGNLLDDFLMPLTTVFGGIITFAWMSHFGFLDPAAAFPLVSGTAFYMFVMLLPYSHASDSGLANLIAPLPDSLNFVAYHRVHHLHPERNFGLMLPTDLLWDWMLGQKTVQA